MSRVANNWRSGTIVGVGTMTEPGIPSTIRVELFVGGCGVWELGQGCGVWEVWGVGCGVWVVGCEVEGVGCGVCEAGELCGRWGAGQFPMLARRDNAVLSAPLYTGVKSRPGLDPGSDRVFYQRTQILRQTSFIRWNLW